jgi:hypothetical protein
MGAELGSIAISHLEFVNMAFYISYHQRGLRLWLRNKQ